MGYQLHQLSIHQTRPHRVERHLYDHKHGDSREGAEASQVYVAPPAPANQPSKRLVGFQKVESMPAASNEVTVTVDPSASNHPLSYWVPDVDAPVSGWGNGTWTAPPGDLLHLCRNLLCGDPTSTDHNFLARRRVRKMRDGPAGSRLGLQQWQLDAGADVGWSGIGLDTQSVGRA